MHAVWVEVADRVLLLLVQAAVVSVLVIFHRAAPALRRWLNGHTSLTERMVLTQLGHEAFRYAEAVFASAPAQVKLAQALGYATHVADRQGLSVSEMELRAAIEQAVHDANAARSAQGNDPVPAPSAAE